jgi:hypothetical protein
MRPVAFAAFAALAVALSAAPALAQSARNASTALKQTSIAAGAITESGLRTTSGVVAIPMGVTALASGAVGVGATASGQYEAGKGFSEASGDMTRAARKAVEFSNAPLVIGNEVIVAKPQPAPKVPFTPVTPAAQ